METIAISSPKASSTVPIKEPSATPIPEGYMSLEQFEKELKDTIRKKL